MHVLITGGAGFIGSNLVRYHLNQGHKVHVVDDLSTGRKENIQPFLHDPNFHFDEGDVLTWSGLERAVSGADVIYHLAAVVGVFKVLKQPIEVLAINIAGCERLLRAARNSHWRPRVIVASSSEVYGNRPIVDGRHLPLHEELELLITPGVNTRWNYSISKLANEAFAISYAKEHDMHVTAVRFFNVCGPGQTGRYGMVVPRFVSQAVNNEPITVFGDGSQTRSFMDVRDTVKALFALAGTEESAGEIVNVGSDSEITILDLAKLVKKLADSESPIHHLDYKDVYGEGFDEIAYRRPALRKLQRLTGFKSRYALVDTINHLVALSKAEKEVDGDVSLVRSRA